MQAAKPKKVKKPKILGLMAKTHTKKSNIFRINLFIAILFFRDNVIQHQRGRINYRGL